MIRPIAAALPLLALACAAGAEPGQPSAYGCAEFEFSAAMPAVEGKDGVFFRTFADLRLQHPMDDAVIAQLGRLSRALAARGTTLIYVAIPAKSQAMPAMLPEHAADYGFDITIAEAVYDDITTRLRAQGILAPDIMRALQAADPSAEKPLFGADFHWSATGARLAADTIGAAIKADPMYAEVTPKVFETRPQGPKEAFSGMRRTLQGFCQTSLPAVESQTWETVLTASSDGALDIGLAPAGETADGDAAAALDIFGTGAEAGARPDVVLIGTSFSDSEVNNFPGFIQQASGLEVVNYAITGGNQFGAITSYLTSQEFQDAPPRFLVWENPIYNNLGQYGPGPIEELIAAADDGCSQPLSADPLGDDGMTADLTAGIASGQVVRGSTVRVDFGAEGARAVDILLVTASGITRTARIERSDRQRATGRFYLDLGSYWMPDLTTITVRFDRPFAGKADTTPGLSLCRTPGGDSL